MVSPVRRARPAGGARAGGGGTTAGGGARAGGDVARTEARGQRAPRPGRRPGAGPLVRGPVLVVVWWRLTGSPRGWLRGRVEDNRPPTTRTRRPGRQRWDPCWRWRRGQWWCQQHHRRREWEPQLLANRFCPVRVITHHTGIHHADESSRNAIILCVTHYIN